MDGFEAGWRGRFDRAARKYDTDHAVSGWSQEGLRRRLATFIPCFERWETEGPHAGVALRGVSRPDLPGRVFATGPLSTAGRDRPWHTREIGGPHAGVALRGVSRPDMPGRVFATGPLSTPGPDRPWHTASHGVPRSTPAGRRILDLGCGAGTYSAWLAARGHRVIALDYSMETLRRLWHRRARWWVTTPEDPSGNRGTACRARDRACAPAGLARPGSSAAHGRHDRTRSSQTAPAGTHGVPCGPPISGGCATLVLGEAYHLPVATGSMDAVVCIGVLQTLDHPRRCLAEIRRVLGKGGALFLMTLNARDVAARLGRLMRRRWADYEDLRRYDPDILGRWCDRVGLRVTRVEPVYVLPDRLTALSRLIERLGIYRALGRLGRTGLVVAHAVLITARAV